jgi:pyruvate formate lyase activating enzyme
MGCIFCHNPESWDPDGGEEVDGPGLLRRLERFRPFLQKPGLTISGGEPLFQPGFTLELIDKAKASGWHVAVDTSGWGPSDMFRTISEEADLIIFSIKHPFESEKLAPGADSQSILNNLKTLAASKTRVRLRYVLIPGWNDQTACLKAVGAMAKEIPNLEKVELLPFNNLAADKWAKLGKVCPILKEQPLKVSEEQIIRAEQTIAWHQAQASC